MRGLPGLLLAGCVTESDLGIARPLAASRAIRLDQVGPWLGRNQPIALMGREAGSFRAAGGQDDRRLVVRAIEQARMIQREIIPR